jgi:hypothetical protein
MSSDRAGGVGVDVGVGDLGVGVGDLGVGVDVRVGDLGVGVGSGGSDLFIVGFNDTSNI